MDEVEALPPAAPVEAAPELPPETEAAAPAEPEPAPALDADELMTLALATVGRLLADSNRRIVREQVKVDGVWYSIEVARP
jgi:hypothetical protein